jgi:hypothetical protein
MNSLTAKVIHAGTDPETHATRLYLEVDKTQLARFNRNLLFKDVRLYLADEMAAGTVSVVTPSGEPGFHHVNLHVWADAARVPVGHVLDLHCPAPCS